MPRTALERRKEKETDGVKAEKKVVNRRLKVLRLADTLGNVSEACRQYNMGRGPFYRCKKRFQKYGLEGLKNLSSRPHKCPQTKSQKVVNKVIALARKNPKWGCRYISQMVKSEGISVSAPTVWKILTKKRLKTK